MKTKKKKTIKITRILFILIVGIIAFGIYFLNQKNDVKQIAKTEPETAKAYTGTKTTEDGLVYKIEDDDTISICDYKGNLIDIVIPEKIEERIVTTISSEAFKDCKRIESIELPNTITSIGDRVFKNCINLKKIEIPENISEIDSETFFQCISLEKIGIPTNIKKIGYGAFGNCKNLSTINFNEGLEEISVDAFENCDSLTNISFPSTLKILGDEAFYGCDKIENIYITENINDIGDNCFGNCKLLTHIQVSENNPGFMSDDGVLYSKTYTYGRWEYILYTYPAGKNDYSFDLTCGVRPYAFAGNRYIGEVNIIGRAYFSYTDIDTGMFYNCTNLTTVNSSIDIYSVGDCAFYGCTNLKSFDLGKTKEIGDMAFLDCKSLTNITIPSTVTSIGESIFNGCENLEEIKVEDGNTKYTSLDGVLYDKSIKTLLCYPANKEELEFSIPETVEYIGHGHTSQLSTAYPPENSWLIYEKPFSYCKNLKKINIGENVTRINGSDFFDCVNLESIEVSENNQQFSSIEGVLYNKDKTELIKYPDGKNNEEYSVYEGTKRILGNAFTVCKNLKKITIPDSVTSINNADNSGCSGELFTCSNLQEIKVNSNNKNYSSVEGVLYSKKGTQLLLYPSAKKESIFIIPENVKSIGEYAFYSCRNLNSVVIPNTITSAALIYEEYYYEWFYDCDVTINAYSHTAFAVDYARVKGIKYKLITNIKDQEFDNRDILTGITVGITKEQLVNDSYFDSIKEIKCIKLNGNELSNTDKIGTGTKVQITDATGNTSEKTILIYGDTTGDGLINAIDALAIIKNKSGAVTFIDEIFTEAGRIISTTGTPSAVDALAIVKYKNGTYNISQTK